VVLAFTIIYSSLELLSWYFTLSILADTNLVTAAAYFSYRITPMIHVILLSMSVISSSYVVKANKMIDLSFEKNDADFLILHTSFFYKSVRLTLLSFFIAIVAVGTRLLLNNL